MYWSVEEEELLVANASRGVEEITESLNKTFNTKRTSSAVKRHANRLGISLKKHRGCFSCGRERVELGRDGLCKVCHVQVLINRQKEENKLLKLEAEEKGLEDMKREYDRLRKENSRLRQKLK